MTRVTFISISVKKEREHTIQGSGVGCGRCHDQQDVASPHRSSARMGPRSLQEGASRFQFALYRSFSTTTRCPCLIPYTRRSIHSNLSHHTPIHVLRSAMTFEVAMTMLRDHVSLRVGEAATTYSTLILFLLLRLLSPFLFTFFFQKNK